MIDSKTLSEYIIKYYTPTKTRRQNSERQLYKRKNEGIGKQDTMKINKIW